MTKVVYNAQYGGFSLSRKALTMLSERMEQELNNYYLEDIPRHNEDLIFVVESLGKSANDSCSDLKIIQLDDDVIAYKIIVQDGKESVELIKKDPDYIYI